VQPSDAYPSSESDTLTDEELRQRLSLLSVEDTAGYVPPVLSVSSQAHEKADMLVAYATVKGTFTWKNLTVDIEIR